MTDLAYVDWPAPAAPVETIEQMLVWQNARCAACGQITSLLRDHDHATGLFRAWLCKRCNILEGKAASDDAIWAAYRARPPAALVGFVEYMKVVPPQTPSKTPPRNDLPTFERSTSQLLSIAETARRMGISAKVVQTMINHGQLPTIPVGGRVRISAAVVDEFLAYVADLVATTLASQKVRAP